MSRAIFHSTHLRTFLTLAIIYYIYSHNWLISETQKRDATQERNERSGEKMRGERKRQRDLDG